MNRADAVQQCSNDGGTLPIPRSNAESQFFYDISVQADPAGYGGWIGISDEAVEGTWVTDDGSDLSWTGWTGNEGNAGGHENAAIIHGVDSNGNYVWRDWPADRLKGTTCVIPQINP